MQPKHLLNRELVKARGIFSFREFRAEDYRPGAKPLREKVLGRNLWLATGNDKALDILAGLDAVPYSNAETTIGVGSDSTAVSREDTGLIDVAAEYATMSPTYPLRVGHQMFWRGVFLDTFAEFEWCEGAIVAGGVALCRCVFDSPFETKGSGLVWEEQYALEIF